MSSNPFKLNHTLEIAVNVVPKLICHASRCNIELIDGQSVENN